MEKAANAVIASNKLKRAGGSEAVRVVVRCRPLSSKEVRIVVWNLLDSVPCVCVCVCVCVLVACHIVKTIVSL